MSANVIEAAAFFLFVAGALTYTIFLYNELVRLRNDNDRAWANIDVLLKQRHDEIPNLVETVKGYMQHEQQTLVALTQARAAGMNAASIGQKAQADAQMTGALRGEQREPTDQENCRRCTNEFRSSHKAVLLNCRLHDCRLHDPALIPSG